MRAAIQTTLSFDPITRRAHPDGLIRAKECAEAGLCIFCEEPVENGPTGRKRLVCRKRGCFRAYHRAYGRDRRRQPFRIATEQVTRTFRAIAENIAKLERQGLGFTSGEPRAAAPSAFSDATRSAPEKESA